MKLSEQRGKRVVLFFYPKDDTPGCTRQACGLRDNFASFESNNTLVYGVTRTIRRRTRRLKDGSHLPYPLLVDKGHKVAEAYGVWGEQQRNVRSHFVIDEEGKLADVQVQITPEESISRALERDHG